MVQSNEKLAVELSESSADLPDPVEVHTGDAAAAAGQAFLLREFGSDENLRSAMRRPGRPKRGAAPGNSPTVRGRVPADDYAKLQEIEARSGKSESELVREGIALVLARYASHAA